MSKDAEKTYSGIPENNRIDYPTESSSSPFDEKTKKFANFFPSEIRSESDAVKIAFINANSKSEEMQLEMLKLQAAVQKENHAYLIDSEKLKLAYDKNKTLRDIEFGKQQVAMDKTSTMHTIEREKNSVELEKKKLDLKNNAFSLGFKPVFFSIAAFLVVFSLIISNAFHNAAMIKAPASSSYYHGRSYEEVIVELKNAGFNNIESRPLNDTGAIGEFFGNIGDIESISINGVPKFKKGTEFPRNAEIVILYHSSKD